MPATVCCNTADNTRLHTMPYAYASTFTALKPEFQAVPLQMNTQFCSLTRPLSPLSNLSLNCLAAVTRISSVNFIMFGLTLA